MDNSDSEAINKKFTQTYNDIATAFNEHKLHRVSRRKRLPDERRNRLMIDLEAAFAPGVPRNEDGVKLVKRGRHLVTNPKARRRS
jgi:hypothetical protein